MEELIKEQLIREFRTMAENLFEKTGLQISEVQFHWVCSGACIKDYFLNEVTLTIK